MTPGVQVAASVDELLADASSRETLVPQDGKSGARFERVVIDGSPYVVKYLALADDWIMRATGDLRGRPLLVWQSGLLERLPSTIDHAIVGAARDGPGAALLMRDVASELVPEGDAPLPLEQHVAFLDHMAELHAELWGWRDDVGLTPLENRYAVSSPSVTSCEAALDSDEPVPRLMGEGSERLPDVAPAAARIVVPLTVSPEPLVTALRTTPQTFLHGDWKLGNLGTRPDGRTILLDWAVPGEGPAGAELAWYLALNRARLPTGHTKEDAIDTYRAALERHGVDTEPWWERQLALSLLGAMVQFGWEKALGDPDELAWLEARTIEGGRLL